MSTVDAIWIILQCGRRMCTYDVVRGFESCFYCTVLSAVNHKLHITCSASYVRTVGVRTIVVEYSTVPEQQD